MNQQATTGDATFPLRLGAIDAGSNAIRMTVADFDSPTSFRPIADDRVPVRLGQDVFLSGTLTQEVMDRAVAGLAALRRQIADLGALRYRAVATSAVRESSNGDEFLARIREEAGLDLEVITGSEEARLVYMAVRQRVPMGRRKWVIADVGGGSVEVMMVDSTGVIWSESHSMGAVRMLEELRLAGDEPGRFRRLVEEYTATLRLATRAERLNAAGFIATGGNIEALAKVAGAEPQADGITVLEVSALRAATESVARLSYAERVQKLSLREDRADVILPAGVLYERLAEFVGADRIIVPGVGVRDGVLLDLAEDVVGHGEHELGQERNLVSAALSLGRRYSFDEEHAAQVSRLALALFERLGPLHGLGEHDRRLLLAAAMLHDIGMFISYKRHHKHSLYLILNSDFAGFAPREVLMTANIARYHRKNLPSTEHEQFEMLSPEERDRVCKLSALLRVADALDREHRQAVDELRVELRNNTVVLHARGEGDLVLESWAVERKSDLFERTFGKKVRLLTAAAV